jgi:acyl-phosphate glycerol 3-phosphate acyltransferase
MFEFAAILLAAYLIGGIPFGYLVARGRGVDILAHGSGNIGATNVGRVLGYRFGLLVFVLDFAKGALPVVGAMLIQKYYPMAAGDLLRDEWLQHGLVEVAAGLMAFLGHVLPVYLGFRGGKGVATGAGVVAVLMPVPALSAIAAWVLLTSAIRYISLASIIAALVLCGIQLAMTFMDVEDPHNWFCVLAVGLVLIRHRSNMTRLLQGTENRLPPSARLDRLARALHVLAVGLCFGGNLFFTFLVTPLVFGTSQELSQLPEEKRPWLLRSAEFDRVTKIIDGSHEQGIRLAGRMVGGIFPSYFLMQILCGAIALVPALSWLKSFPAERVHGVRVWLVLGGLLLAVAGIWMERVVHDLQGPRNEAVARYLKSQTSPSSADLTLVEEMNAAKARFGIWHGISVLTNYAAILMVTGVMILTVWLPNETVRSLRAGSVSDGENPSLALPAR